MGSINMGSINMGSINMGSINISSINMGSINGLEIIIQNSRSSESNGKVQVMKEFIKE